MNRIEALRAAYGAKREAKAALDALPRPATKGFDEVTWKRCYYRLKDLENDLHAILTDDTIAALIAVAEAGMDADDAITCGAECGGNIVQFMDEDSDYLFIEKSAARKLAAALAYFVEEEADDRA